MTEIPEWIATLVGRLQLENELLRRTLAEMQQAQPNGHQPMGPAMPEQFVAPETVS